MTIEEEIVGKGKVVINIAKQGKNSEDSQKKNEYRINDQIRADECRLIGSDGEQMGIMSVSEAQDIADDEGLDLVEIAPNNDPVVCRIMNYSKFRYEQQKRERENRKNSKGGNEKEMKFRCNIGVGDYETKKKHIQKFLAKGDKVKITIMFKGREISHPDLGLEILGRLTDDLQDCADVVSAPNMEGRNMTMMLAPIKNK